jgi:uncharacterized protein with PIN domain
LGWQAQFRFDAELNDFLEPGKRLLPVACEFNSGQSVKHLIESIGVPHTEVHRILVNGAQVDFDYLVQDGDQVQVYPLSAATDGDQLPSEWRFILDNHLGRLAVYLRMLGFDSLYRNDFQDEELAQRSHQEGRILLTRDRHLLMRNLVAQGHWVRSTIPRVQLAEVVKRYELGGQITPFRRCMRCNGLLKPVPKEAVLDRLEPLTRRYFNDFCICQSCSQVYWKGSHYERMQRLIDQVIHD